MIAEQPAFGPEAEVETGEIEASVEVDPQLHAANRAAHRLGGHVLYLVLREPWLAVKYPEFYKAVRAYQKVVDW